MRQAVGFKVDKHKATCQIIVEHKVDVEMLVIERDAFLPCHERKSFAQFKEEQLQLVNQHLLQIAFKEMLSLRYAKELKDQWVADYFFRSERIWGSLADFAAHGFLVA